MKHVCIICGAEFKDGKGWTEEHLFPCANKRYGWFFTVDVPSELSRDEYIRKGVIAGEGINDSNFADHSRLLRGSRVGVAVPGQEKDVPSA